MSFRLDYDKTLRTPSLRHELRAGPLHWYRSLPLSRTPAPSMRSPSMFVPMFFMFAAGFATCLACVVVVFTT